MFISLRCWAMFFTSWHSVVYITLRKWVIFVTLQCLEMFFTLWCHDMCVKLQCEDIQHIVMTRLCSSHCDVTMFNTMWHYHVRNIATLLILSCCSVWFCVLDCNVGLCLSHDKVGFCLIHYENEVLPSFKKNLTKCFLCHKHRNFELMWCIT